jgi:CheY-like chemotaxis protein
MVIDDEHYIADSLTEILNESGHEATAFYSGLTALDAAQRECPDFVVSDVMMPEFNGLETAMAIRELCPSTRILLFSGQAGTANLMEAARNQGHEFELLPKLIHPTQLLKRLLNT